jgi:hypothetical protein
MCGGMLIVAFVLGSRLRFLRADMAQGICSMIDRRLEARSKVRGLVG